jgi:hypothetical protein
MAIRISIQYRQKLLTATTADFLTSNAYKMTLNQLFSTFYLIFRFLHLEIDEYPKKIEKLTL